MYKNRVKTWQKEITNFFEIPAEFLHLQDNIDGITKMFSNSQYYYAIYLYTYPGHTQKSSKSLHVKRSLFK